MTTETPTPPGADDSFRHFVQEASPRLLRAAVLLAPDRDSAEDLVQTTLLRVGKRWRVARQEPFAYARKVLTNLIRDELRTRRRHPELYSRGELVEAEQPGVGDFTEGVTERMGLVAAMRMLSPEQRAVLVARFYLDIAVGETAELLNLPEGTVKSSTSRALSALAAHSDLYALEDDCAGLGGQK
jgi:RNA polymerase sigma-70 factor (sigma-E family)